MNDPMVTFVLMLSRDGITPIASVTGSPRLRRASLEVGQPDIPMERL